VTANVTGDGIAAGQLVTVFVPQDAEVTARAAVAVFMWYTEKAGRKYAPQAMALFRSLRIVSMSQQSWPPSSVLQQFSGLLRRDALRAGQKAHRPHAHHARELAHSRDAGATRERIAAGLAQALADAAIDALGCANR
jgi:hypothetical protein